MWRIETLELMPATLDFTSSGQGYRQVTKVISDGVELINAVELVDWAADETQFLVCEACGIEGCEPGNWVSLRRSGSLVLILPSLDYVWAERDEDKTVYAPPWYLRKRGVAYFDQSTYENLRSQHSDFPAFEQIRHLNMREATLVFHWDAPAQVLGSPPVVELRHDLIAGSSEGDSDEHLKRLTDLMNQQYKDESAAILRPLSPDDHPLSIYLNAAEFIEWKPLTFDAARYQLMIDSKFVMEK